MALLLVQIFVLVLSSGALADIKILDTPDGKMGPEPCVRVCSGIDRDYTGWDDSSENPGEVYKWIHGMSGCGFVSAPVVTVSGGSISSSDLCPSFTHYLVSNTEFFLYSVSGSSRDKMINHKCEVYWTATGFTC